MITNFDGDYRFLSNFWPYVLVPVSEGSPFKRGEYVEPPFNCKGKLVRTVEHAFQAQKTLDKERREEILDAITPGIAKRMGRRVVLRPRWDDIKVSIMREILVCKFAPGTLLAQRLLATGDEELIEGNTWNDTFWGCVQQHRTWIGANNLGILLMEIRAQIATLPRNTGGGTA